MPRVDVSSSEIRARVRDGLPIRYLVPDDVVRYIGARALYAETPAAAAEARS
jgi:nicotinate-nucleotide adenylyltransferase